MESIRSVYVGRFGDEPMFMSLERFMAIPRSARALMVVDGSVEFIDERGWTIPIQDALRELSETWQAHGLRSVPASSSDDDERRAHPRFAFVRSVSVNGDEVGVCQDISRGGMRLRTRRSFAPGDTIDVRWTASNVSGTEATRTAVVRRVEADEADPSSLFPVSLAVEFAPTAPLAAA